VSPHPDVTAAYAQLGTAALEYRQAAEEREHAEYMFHKASQEVRAAADRKSKAKQHLTRVLTEHSEDTSE